MEMATGAVRLLSTLTESCTNSTLLAYQKNATNLSDLWHPYVLLFLGHSIWCAIGTVLSLYAPRCTIGIMVASGIPFLASAIFRISLWEYETFSFIWWGQFVKWLIVNVCATIPVLALRGFKTTPKTQKIVGIFVYVILGANIIWTLGMDSERHIVVYLNRVAGVMLVIALILHCVAVCRAGLGLFEVRKRFPYGFGTSLPWLVCYTVWNALFVAKISIGMLLQDILFWCLMLAYQHWDDYHLPVELYFGYARPVQLGLYIAFAEFNGVFVGYFRDAPTLKEHQPLPVNSHAFFLYIAFINMLWSFLVTFWAGQRLACGLGFFGDRFNQVHGIESDSDDDARELKEALQQEEEAEDGEEEEGEDDEEGSGCIVA